MCVTVAAHGDPLLIAATDGGEDAVLGVKDDRSARRCEMANRRVSRAPFAATEDAASIFDPPEIP